MLIDIRNFTKKDRFVLRLKDECAEFGTLYSARQRSQFFVLARRKKILQKTNYNEVLERFEKRYPSNNGLFYRTQTMLLHHTESTEHILLSSWGQEQNNVEAYFATIHCRVAVVRSNFLDTWRLEPKECFVLRRRTQYFNEWRVFPLSEILYAKKFKDMVDKQEQRM